MARIELVIITPLKFEREEDKDEEREEDKKREEEEWERRG